MSLQTSSRVSVFLTIATSISLISALFCALLADSLPENSPRFVLLSHTLQHPDGRVSFPLVILYWAPQTSSMELSTLYTSALSNFSVKADVGKVIDIRDGELDSAAMDKRLLG